MVPDIFPTWNGAGSETPPARVALLPPARTCLLGLLALCGLPFFALLPMHVHARNWEAMGDEANALRCRTWFWGMAAGLAGAGMLPGWRLPLVACLVVFALGGVWYVRLGRVQILEVQGRFGSSYRRRGWLHPMVFCVGVGGVALAPGVLLHW